MNRTRLDILKWQSLHRIIQCRYFQHNQADFSTWGEIDHYMGYMMDKHVLFDNTLIELKRQIEQAAELKMEIGGVDIKMVKQRVADRYQ